MRQYASAGAVLVWFALLLQVYLTLHKAPGGQVFAALVTVFSYFTVLTNLLVAVVFTAVALGKRTFFSSVPVQAATAVYITVVGLCYHLLLRQTWNPQGAQLIADQLLHYVAPAGYVLYWFFFAPREGLQWQDAAKWLMYPAGYLVYSMVRGAVSGVYPYPFIDRNVLGYGRVLLNAAALTLLFLAMGLALVAIGRRANREQN